MDGRAAPIKSWVPLVICLSMVSGEVNLPTLTTGLLVRDFIFATAN